MLPWLCGIQEDYKTLEIAKGGSWNEISAAHRDLYIGPATPSGLSVNYGRIPYSFPALVHYNLSNPVAAALVGRTKWSCGSVATEAYKIITNNKYGREACKVQEDKVVAIFVPKFREMIVLERYIFGKNSFFNVMCDTRTADSIRLEPTIDEGNNKG
ncbi:hypothetical protein EG328_010271 [Venturia inaequalis]|uniref:Uncharacterized protein n=1 Tax=Venturia inaequalis TaxID=5025 RepID=A0A8H3U8B5_VENIN|nr:hypothetical protein EG328_010271 [Venturia inaequalis]